MREFCRWAGAILLWIGALFVGLAPERMWKRLEPVFPLRSAAFASGILTLLVGFFLDVGGFLSYGARRAIERNDQIMDAVHQGLAAKAILLSDAGAALAMLTLVEFLFLTPLGLFATYLLASGSLRVLSAWADDPRGDFLLTGIHWAATSLHVRNRQDRERIARERREGPEAPDVLRSGRWAGLAGVDYVLLASRRKAEWTAGAIILTSADWYRLGAPFDRETPAGLRTVYPLTKLETVEVVRRGIEYELPRLNEFTIHNYEL